MCLLFETSMLYYCFTLFLLPYYSAATTFVLPCYYDTTRDLSDPNDGAQERSFLCFEGLFCFTVSVN
jgi:hypothetical protein